MGEQMTTDRQEKATGKQVQIVFLKDKACISLGFSQTAMKPMPFDAEYQVRISICRTCILLRHSVKSGIPRTWFYVAWERSASSNVVRVNLDMLSSQVNDSNLKRDEYLDVRVLPMIHYV
jgi:hypothetical protein